MNDFYKQLLLIFDKHNAYLVRKGKGDHEIWRCGDKQTTVDHGINSRYRANKILKQLGINEKI